MTKGWKLWLVRSGACDQSYLEARVGTAEGMNPVTAGGLHCGQGHLPGEAVSSASWETRWQNLEERLSGLL